MRIPLRNGEILNLNLKRNRKADVFRFFKKVTPFAAAGAIQLRSTPAPVFPNENRLLPRKGLNGVSAGILLGGGVLNRLGKASQKPFAEVTLYDNQGNKIQSRSTWLNRTTTRIQLQNEELDGYAVLKLEGTNKQPISVEGLITHVNPISPKHPSSVSKLIPGPQPTPLLDPNDPNVEDFYEDFGVIGGSGTMDDPFRFTEVSVFGSNNSEPAFNLGGNTLYYIGGYYNNTYGFPGYYHYVGSVGLGGPSGTQDHPTLKDPIFYQGAWGKRQATFCGGYKYMIDYMKRDHKEYHGFRTTSGHLIILPNDNSTQTTVNWSNIYNDLQGRPIVNVYEENGQLKVQLNTFEGPQKGSQTFTVASMIHTHPTLPGYDYGNPSPLDLNVAANYPMVSHEIITETEMFSYTPGGHNNDNVQHPHCP